MLTRGFRRYQIFFYGWIFRALMWRLTMLLFFLMRYFSFTKFPNFQLTLSLSILSLMVNSSEVLFGSSTLRASFTSVSQSSSILIFSLNCRWFSMSLSSALMCLRSDCCKVSRRCGERFILCWIRYFFTNINVSITCTTCSLIKGEIETLFVWNLRYIYCIFFNSLI